VRRTFTKDEHFLDNFTYTSLILNDVDNEVAGIDVLQDGSSIRYGEGAATDENGRRRSVEISLSSALQSQFYLYPNASYNVTVPIAVTKQPELAAKVAVSLSEAYFNRSNYLDTIIVEYYGVDDNTQQLSSNESSDSLAYATITLGPLTSNIGGIKNSTTTFQVRNTR
jgi:hypothetical protein